jgi:hypothetical protein
MPMKRQQLPTEASFECRVHLQHAAAAERVRVASGPPHESSSTCEQRVNSEPVDDGPQGADGALESEGRPEPGAAHALH